MMRKSRELPSGYKERVEARILDLMETAHDLWPLIEEFCGRKLVIEQNGLRLTVKKTKKTQQ